MAGRINNPCSYLPRRLQIVVSLSAAILFCFIILLGTASSPAAQPYIERVPYGPRLEQGAHQVVQHLPHVLPPPRWLSPFRTPAHRPPAPPEQQPNSASGEAKWFADFKWRNPFSSEVTRDDDRAVLPPLLERPRVYTYFDPEDRRPDEKSRRAEQDLLQIWRRAWWAQGFRPVVLSRSEAMNNPLYQRVQALKLAPELQLELMKWLAWANMGTGILSNWLCVPMAPYDDNLLSSWRKGNYPTLTRYQGLENALYVGSKDQIEKAVQSAVESKNLDVANSIVDIASADTFSVEADSSGLACYNTPSAMAKFPAVQSKLADDATVGDGLNALAALINSHLHATWQSQFPRGIAVVKPEPKHTTSMIEPAIDIARNLSACSYSPLPATCPPNRPRCQPCVSMRPLHITTPPVLRTTTDRFTIATVPHPYTLQALIHREPELNLALLRRNTQRDVWLLAATKELLGVGISSFARLAPLKDAVHSASTTHRALWLTAESPLRPTHPRDLEDLDWTFGFLVPRHALNSGESETPVPGPERRPPPPVQEFDGPQPSPAQLRTQRSLLERVSHPAPAARPVVAAAEAWNLADAEAWKFVRALQARRALERRSWEDEERDFLGKGTIYDRWRDLVEGVVLG